MINNYTDFLIEQELKHWELISQMIKESSDSDNLKDRIFNYLEDAAKKGDESIIKIAKKIFNYFKSNPKVLVLVIGLLIARFAFTKDEVVDMLPMSQDQNIEMVDKAVGEDTKERKNGLVDFLDAIAQKESTGDPTIVNELGYMGKYQFGKIALEDVGKIKNQEEYKKFLNKFKKNPHKVWPESKQDEAMKKLLSNNKKYLGDYISKYVGKTKKGIDITLSGLLAGCHLLGASNVKDFLDRGVVTRDANGTPITEYIEKFGGYNIKI